MATQKNIMEEKLPPIAIITIGELLDEWIPISYATKRPLMVRSKPGMGKTSAFIQFANRMNIELLKARGEDVEDTARSRARIKATVALENRAFGYIDSRAPMMNPTDIKGFPYADKTTGVSGWLPPDKFPTLTNIKAGRVPEQGIWVVEEMPLSPPLTQSSFAQPLQERHINGDPLGDGWVMAATGNRLQDRSGVSKLPAFVVNRFWHVEITPSIEEWSSWAVRAGLHPMVIAFFRHLPSELDTFDPETWEQDTPYCSPRSAELLSDVVGAFYERRDVRGAKPSLDMLVGAVGRSAAQKFFAFLDVATELPSIEEVISNPEKAKVPSRSNNSALFAAATMMASHAAKESVDPMVVYLRRLPKEFEILGCKDILEAKSELVSSAEMGKWCEENAPIILKMRRR